MQSWPGMPLWGSMVGIGQRVCLEVLVWVGDGGEVGRGRELGDTGLGMLLRESYL